jgi:hypothetical protein
MGKTVKRATGSNIVLYTDNIIDIVKEDLRIGR